MGLAPKSSPSHNVYQRQKHIFSIETIRPIDGINHRRQNAKKPGETPA